jgi:alcohol dehydrogenase
MKAAIYREHNKDPRKVVNIEDIEIPSIKYNQVLIKVEAASYNTMIFGEFGENQSRFLSPTFLEVMYREL